MALNTKNHSNSTDWYTVLTVREYLLQTATNVSCLSEAISGPFFINDVSHRNQAHRVSCDRHWLHMLSEIQLPIYHDNNGQLVPNDGHMICTVYLTVWYGSCERVHVIIKHEHYNTVYALFAFQTKYAKQNLVLKIIDAKQPFTLR
jgi:hypothetical protein